METNIEIKLGGLFDGEYVKDDPFIQKIKDQFLSDTSKYIETGKSDEWFCSDIFRDFQYRNKNDIKDLSWIRTKDTFRFYYQDFPDNHIGNRELIHSLYIGCEDITMEFYDKINLRYKEPQKYKPSLERLKLKIQNRDKFMKLVKMINIDIDEELKELRNWEPEMIEYLDDKKLIHVSEFELDDLLGCGSVNLLEKYYDTETFHTIGLEELELVLSRYHLNVIKWLVKKNVKLNMFHDEYEFEQIERFMEKAYTVEMTKFITYMLLEIKPFLEFIPEYIDSMDEKEFGINSETRKFLAQFYNMFID